MDDFDFALAELQAERPGWLLTLTGMGATWFAALKEPVPAGGPACRTFIGGEGRTPAQAVHSALAMVRERVA